MQITVARCTCGGQTRFPLGFPSLPLRSYVRIRQAAAVGRGGLRRPRNSNKQQQPVERTRGGGTGNVLTHVTRLTQIHILFQRFEKTLSIQDNTVICIHIAIIILTRDGRRLTLYTGDRPYPLGGVRVQKIKSAAVTAILFWSNTPQGKRHHTTLKPEIATHSNTQNTQQQSR